MEWACFVSTVGCSIGIRYLEGVRVVGTVAIRPKQSCRAT